MKQALRKTQSAWALVVLSSLLLVGAAGRGEDAQRIPVTIGASQPHYVWEQPPLELDALSKTPFVCGWDQASYVEEIDVMKDVKYYAMDDFHCADSSPVTSIHWWGSYKGWQGTVLPAGLPDVWRITFFESVPDEANYPGAEARKFDVDPDRVSAEWVALERLNNKTTDSCFKYTLTLNSREYFWPAEHEGSVFWISIQAVYKTERAEHPWGWSTRPKPWGAGAWQLATSPGVTPGVTAAAAMQGPVTGSNSCGQNVPYDMSFALGTDSSWIKAEQPFTGLRDWAYYEDAVSKATGQMISGIFPKWTQMPDRTSSGQNVDATSDTPKSWDPEIIADDFECRQTGSIDSITIWGGWYNGAPDDDPGNVEFVLSIHADLPPSGSRAYSMPGAVLWTRTFKKGQFGVQASNTEDQGYSSSAASKSFSKFIWQGYQYFFSISDETAFVQTGTADKPVVYWLSVQAKVNRVGDTTPRFGWKTSTATSGGDAVWAKGTEPYSGSWQKWSYPFGHPRSGQAASMAFTLYTTAVNTSETVEHEVADDWKSEGTAPLVAAAWWGSYVGYTYQACACNDQPEPVKPAYFLLSIWSHVPDPNSANPQDFAHPGEKLWEYAALKYNEVLVGFDNGPAGGNPANGREPVFRYSVTLPTYKRFVPEAGRTYWLSVMAVYSNPKAVNYPWGWTNHEQASVTPAVVGLDATDASGQTVRTWQRLRSGANDLEDMSFTLFQQGQTPTG